MREIFFGCNFRPIFMFVLKISVQERIIIRVKSFMSKGSSFYVEKIRKEFDFCV